MPKSARPPLIWSVRPPSSRTPGLLHSKETPCQVLHVPAFSCTQKAWIGFVTSKKPSPGYHGLRRRQSSHYLSRIIFSFSFTAFTEASLQESPSPRRQSGAKTQPSQSYSRWRASLSQESVRPSLVERSGIKTGRGQSSLSATPWIRRETGFRYVRFEPAHSLNQSANSRSIGTS